MVNKIEFQAPLISIGIPVFNGEQFISEAINSLLEQTEVRFEIIISDNCSTDGTHGICTKYAKIDSRIRLIRQKENLGAYANFIKVFEQARGDYFIWAACDDLWSPDWLEKLLLLQGEGTAISFGSVENICENGLSLRQYRCRNLYKNKLTSKLKFFLEEDTLGKANIIYGMYRTKLIKEVGLETIGRGRYADDMLLVFEFLQYGNVLFDPSARLYKRVPNYVPPKVSLKHILRRVFLTERFPNYVGYGFAVKTVTEKLFCFSLIPLKYLLSFLYNFKILVKIAFSRIQDFQYKNHG